MNNCNPIVGTQNQQTRDEWIAKVLSNLPSGIRILDAGAGEMVYKKYCSHLNYVSQDFATYDGEGDGVGLQTGSWDCSDIDIKCDIAKIPEQDASFDAILCSEVFEHLPDPLAALKELDRLLKPQGKMILTAPFCSATHFAPYHFSTGFNYYYYEKHLGDLGYEILECEYNGNFFEYIAQELSRVPYIRDRYTEFRRYTDTEYEAIKTVFSILQKYSDNDAGSKEFLSHGLHIIAKKL